MSVIEIFSGSESWTNHSAKMSVFHVNTETGEEKPLSVHVATLPDTGRRLHILNKQVIQARPGMRAELGQWFRINYDLPPRTLLKIFAQRHLSQGSPHDKAGVFIRIRDEAAHRELTMALSVATIGSLDAVRINGRFDVLRLEDVFREYPVEVANHFQQMYSPLNVARVFADNVISGEQEAPAAVYRTRVRNDRDQEVTILRPRRRRAMEL